MPRHRKPAVQRKSREVFLPDLSLQTPFREFLLVEAEVMTNFVDQRGANLVCLFFVPLADRF